jgi:predicted NUDIX family NTP pyrophosphohydrolase
MAKSISAGLLLYRRSTSALEVLLAHPGGPFFARKDHGAWTIPKGAPEASETLAQAAQREFFEEIGIQVGGELIELGAVRQRSGKLVHAWAVLGDLPPDFVLRSNEFELEWPPGSGRVQRFPEVDRVQFFALPEASTRIIAAQRPFLERLSLQVTSASGS